MSTISVVFDDKVIVKDGVGIHVAGDDLASFDALVSQLNHSGAHAIQWDGSSGEIEHKDGTPHTVAQEAEVTPYSSLFDTITENIRQNEKTAWLSLDADEISRSRRDGLLAETDWWVLGDRTATEAQLSYRQALRDLPTTDSWNPTMSWDDDTWTGSVTGVTWPTKP